jgi:hypothetical protein
MRKVFGTVMGLFSTAVLLLSEADEQNREDAIVKRVALKNCQMFTSKKKITRQILNKRRRKMAGIVQQLQDILRPVDDVIAPIFRNPYVATALKVFLVLYAALLAPALPAHVLQQINTVPVRLLFAFAIVFLATQDYVLGLIAAVAFVMTMTYANRSTLWQTSIRMNGEDGQTSWLPSNGGVVVSPGVSSSGYSDSKVISDSLRAEGFSSGFPFQDAGAPVPAQSNEPIKSTFLLLNVDNTNTVPGADQQSCVKTWTNEMCPQGIQPEGGVVGFDENMIRYSKLTNSN